MKMTAVAIVAPRRCLGLGAMHRIAPTIGQAAIFKAERAIHNFDFFTPSRALPPDPQARKLLSRIKFEEGR
jgi:hypothetical protein